jgi:hypothetical protein
MENNKNVWTAHIRSNNTIAYITHRCTLKEESNITLIPNRYGNRYIVNLVIDMFVSEQDAKKLIIKYLTDWKNEQKNRMESGSNEEV